MTNCGEMCLSQVQQDFASELGAYNLGIESRTAALTALSAVIRPAIDSCIDCPMRPNKIDPSQPERTRLIETMVNDPALDHFLIGNFSNAGFQLSGCRNKNNTRWNNEGDPYGDREDPHIQHRQADIETATGLRPLYEAIVLKKPLAALDHPNGFSFRLTYLDLSPYDARPGIATNYTVKIPDNVPYVQKIEQDPTIMIDLMRQVFPKADRSAGKLHLATREIQTLKADPPEYVPQTPPSTRRRGFFGR